MVLGEIIVIIKNTNYLEGEEQQQNLLKKQNRIKVIQQLQQYIGPPVHQCTEP